MNIVNFEDIKKEMNVATNNVARLRKNLSEADKLENEILHQIESDEKLSACDGYKYAKAIRDVRIKRRIIKQTLFEQTVIAEKLRPFVDSYEQNKENTEKSTISGKKKYVKNFNDITIKLNKIKTL